eukprot:340503_1
MHNVMLCFTTKLQEYIYVIRNIFMHRIVASQAVSCLLHTILLVRAPGHLCPKESYCRSFDLSFSRCGVADVDRMVDEAVDALQSALTPAGPDIRKGCATLSFFERRVKKSMFHLISNEEKIHWEYWILPIVVNDMLPEPGTPGKLERRQSSSSEIEKQCLSLEHMREERHRAEAHDMLTSRLEKIFEIVNGTIEHVPPVMYEFSISVSDHLGDKKAGGRYSRIAPVPL